MLPDWKERDKVTWAAFFVGMFVGGFIGLGAMCLCVVSGDESRREELRTEKADTEQKNSYTSL